MTKVVLVTYFRGGSTFLGEMLNNNHAAFYMFEPLLIPFEHWANKAPTFVDNLYYYRNGTQ